MKYRLLLLLAALIWGFAFVAQVVGMDSMGPFTFNGVRLLIGSLALTPLLLKSKSSFAEPGAPYPLWIAVLMVGIPLFAGATLQQLGLQYTTASKSSLLTAVYILLVPLFGLFIGKALQLTHIVGAIFAMLGVYYISITGDFTISPGDTLSLLCAVGFAVQILCMEHLTQKFSPIVLSAGQFFVAGMLNLILAFLFETPTLDGILQAWWPLIYTGVFSTGVAYTLQSVGQKHVPSTEASMLLSLEMVFGSIAGMLFLGDSFTLRQYFGIFAMIVGVFSAQFPSRVILHFSSKERRSF